MRSGTLSALVTLAVVGSTPSATAGSAPDLAIGHRRSTLVVDGDPSDWAGAPPPIVIERPDTGGEPRARAAVRLVWDRHGLWALFDVVDPTLRMPPVRVTGPALFQWDSVELYVDGRGDREPRMGGDDFQVILSADGRTAALQGDALLREIAVLEVPKRERPWLAIEAAARRTASGYVVECTVPWAALGIVAGEGRELALDVALNDWLGDHPLFEQLEFDLDTIRRLERKPPGAAESFSRHGLAGEGADVVERRLYRPWSWSGSADFGRPPTWRSARLVGAPPFAERLIGTLGPGPTLAAGALGTALLLTVTLTASQWRHRNRIQALLGRMAQLETKPPPGPEAPRPAPSPETREDAPSPAAPRPDLPPPDSLDWLARIAERDGGTADPERFELRAMRIVRARLAEPLTPARLAGELCVSLRTLERHLAHALSCTPGELILAVKMREARHLLEQGGWQVQEVAHRVGFDDPSHFSRRYKAYFGAAPAAARAAAHARPPAA